jgi:hypothetical protein
MIKDFLKGQYDVLPGSRTCRLWGGNELKQGTLLCKGENGHLQIASRYCIMGYRQLQSKVVYFLKTSTSLAIMGIISDENHFFHQILLRLSAKLPCGYLGIPLFSFFKISTLNRNINNENFGLFVTVQPNF